MNGIDNSGIYIVTYGGHKIFDNDIHDAYWGVRNLETANNTVTNNQIFATYCYLETGVADYNIVRENRLVGTVPVTLTGSHSSALRNVGYVTEKSGTGTINSGSTSAVITHGCSYTPVAGDFAIIFTENATNAIGNWWLSSVNATSATLNVANDPGASNQDFSWSVRKN
jgi:hypothetical protein